ncbi:phage tail sheath C-terminal domain-containing protein [Kordia sp.]|uniref:phage tail sheath family protein n=1 Tax=Kordia sp. TaxID=1965332 RepID=UPI0025BAC86D|nr:phage tail sheath C-terminal domain-containing protein [Kordia sp.]MCH2193499.1 phage tail sheath subtilisin-like domain-containing protein [Kordia sp.]
MPSTLKTPGVYVEEIVKFPPSVAQVETAIPAFIGYTEKATNKLPGDLNNIPTRITSLLEYERFFGGAKAETTITVTVTEDSDNNKTIAVTQPTAKEPFIMYYSMQLYFANGGGPSYIVSVGRYGSVLADSETAVTGIADTVALKAGLDEVAKVDEPTLLLFPDLTRADSIDTSTFYGLYNDALTQCNKLQDRFTIIDTLSYDGSTSTDPNVAALRSGISLGKDFVKYGAAYYPHLETILNYTISETGISVVHTGGSSPAPLAQAKANAAKDILEGYTTDGVLADLETTMEAAITALAGASDDSGALALVPDVINAVDAIIAHLENVISEAEKLVDAGRDAADASSVPADTAAVTAAVNALDTVITSHVRSGIVSLEGDKDSLSAAADQTEADTAGTSANGNVDALDIAVEIDARIAAIITAIDTIVTAGGSAGILNGKTLAEVETLDNSTYNKIKTAINNLPMELPPSSAVAGVYARVDSTRGVWKAPANEGLSYVVKPTVRITNDIQDGLNVDTTTGKSINAIRSFTGKGILVWGARTLAGNDNEWRYISVRRFFNMVEESVKKASDQFVFEANDANTWVRIRSMIENFLVNQWKAGALAGATADEAFYVKVGLNQTMTADDILNGIMNVEIGMAVVRPAEFIVLKFSHKMQES